MCSVRFARMGCPGLLDCQGRLEIPVLMDTPARLVHQDLQECKARKEKMARRAYLVHLHQRLRVGRYHRVCLAHQVHQESLENADLLVFPV